MEEVVILSSDEEDNPPAKRIKPSPVNESTTKETKSKEDDVVTISIDEDPENDNASSNEENNVNLQNSQEIPKTNENSQRNDEENSPETISDNVAETNDSEQPCCSKKDKYLSHQGFCNFLSICEEKTKNTSFNLTVKFPIVKKMVNKASQELLSSITFDKKIERCTRQAEQSELEATIAFADFFKYLKETLLSETCEVDSEKTVTSLKKLEHFMTQLKRKILKLEEAEVDFDEEEDSSYLKLSRYYQRYSDVYKKYCDLLKRNPYSGRLTHDRLGFVNSDYNEINLLINKKYKNNTKFPTYYDIEKCVKKCNTDSKLGLSEGQIKVESRKCFENLGHLLQIRRKRELYDIHSGIVEVGQDPAKEDETLDKTLRMNLAEGKKKIQKICDEFVDKQETLQIKEEPKEKRESSDSDDSHYEDSEDSSAEEKVKKKNDEKVEKKNQEEVKKKNEAKVETKNKEKIGKNDETSEKHNDVKKSDSATNVDEEYVKEICDMKGKIGSAEKKDEDKEKTAEKKDEKKENTAEKKDGKKEKTPEKNDDNKEKSEKQKDIKEVDAKKIEDETINIIDDKKIEDETIHIID